MKGLIAFLGFVVGMYAGCNQGYGFFNSLGLAFVGFLVGYVIGIFIERNYEERECNQCGFIGKGRDWKEGHCPNCGSSSYTVKD